MSSSDNAIEVVVVGAGVVGLAIAKVLAENGKQVLLLESASSIGTGTSSRNSEIIHSGIYYAPGSLRAQLCVDGKKRLYQYCSQKNIPHKRLGKLLVAVDSPQVEQLRRFQTTAAKNGVDDLQWLEGDEAKALEPALRCHAAILSPSTGIVDSRRLMQAYLADFQAAGGKLQLNSKVTGGDVTGKLKHVRVENLCSGAVSEVEARMVVNAAGLHAQEVASCLNVPEEAIPVRHLCKGNYFSLKGKAPFKHLIYPMPNEAGLGTHLTVDLAGSAKFGPDVEYVDDLEYSVNASRLDTFYQAIRLYWPGISKDALEPSFSGVRPKLHGPGTPQGDFVIDDILPGMVNLYGIESPGLTSSLSIAKMVTTMLLRPSRSKL